MYELYISAAVRRVLSWAVSNSDCIAASEVSSSLSQQETDTRNIYDTRKNQSVICRSSREHEGHLYKQQRKSSVISRIHIISSHKEKAGGPIQASPVFMRSSKLFLLHPPISSNPGRHINDE